ncbi:c-type cytochrome, partial [Ideonella sp.]|uniref:c-type cytochrome n=1 Tax=Ideonella sp. TaxID=1929293 RepID=UPI003BB7896F
MKLPAFLNACPSRWPLLLLGWVVCAVAQAQSAPGDDRDGLAQRLKACTACHGVTDRVGPDAYYPRIAGKPASYLLAQMHNFRQGRRHHEAMTGLLLSLEPGYLSEIAAYFSAQHAPYPAPAAMALDARALQRGEAVVRRGLPALGVPACVACHGQQLAGVAPSAVPGLLGLPRNYLTAQLSAWRQGQRRAVAPDCMAEVARRLPPDDLTAAVLWLA